jgi:hypothetical protein
MDSMDIWSLCHEMTVVQAALYVSHNNPSCLHEVVEDMVDLDRPANYEPIKQLILGGIRCGDITGHLVPLFVCDSGGSKSPVDHSIDPQRSTVDMDSLQIFLAALGLDLPLGRRKTELPKKLQAAIDASWATKHMSLKGKTRKQALTDWLEKHAAAYGLVDDRGRPIERAIEEIARLANPDTQGGAPKTPS